MLVSVASTDNRELLEHCLESLQPALGSLASRVVVTDNASRDGTAAMVRAQFPWAELVENRERKGFAANHNAVLRTALDADASRYVLVMHEDLVLGAGSIERLAAFCDATPSIGAVAPQTVGADGARHEPFRVFPSTSLFIRTALWPRTKPGAPHETGWLDGACTLFRTAALREAGVYDERFFLFFEDVDLSLRLQTAGWKVAPYDGATITHVRHATIAKAPGAGLELALARSRYLFVRKHRSWLEATAVAWAARAGAALRAAKALALGRRELAGLLLAIARYNPRRTLPHEHPT